MVDAKEVAEAAAALAGVAPLDTAAAPALELARVAWVAKVAVGGGGAVGADDPPVKLAERGTPAAGVAAGLVVPD